MASNCSSLEYNTEDPVSLLQTFSQEVLLPFKIFLFIAISTEGHYFVMICATADLFLLLVQVLLVD
jgi:hypothetical protein